MVQTREEKKEYHRQYRQNNKEHIAAQKKAYSQANKEHFAEKRREYYENNKEQITEKARLYKENNKEQIASWHKANYQNNKERTAKQIEYNKIYNKTPAGKKVMMMGTWRHRGVINVNDEMYNHYIASTHCECCSKEFSSSRDRHLDHDHETGEYRWVICCSCNNHDNWKKITH